MKWTWLLPLLLVALAASQDESVEEELPLAENCDQEACQLPNCRCSSTDIPGNLQARDTPQFVLFTFDDAINVLNIETYRSLLDNRRNVNQCPVGTTYYVSHEYTNYQLVNELYNKGQEIALHSISHRTPQTYWQEADVEVMRREFGDQRQQIAHFANIPIDTVKGVRMPFLQMTGNATFQMMAEFGLEYDCSWPTVTFINPGLWPYTLDYASIQDCVVPPCPSASIPGKWVLPMVTWRDLNGSPCAMVDGCFAVPPLNDEDAWFQFIVSNFERHYLGNRAPFGFFIHEWYLATNQAVLRATVRFMDMLNNLHDVFMVNSADVIDWVKNPIPVDEYVKQPCKNIQSSQCSATSCGPLHSVHNSMDYWMQICTSCPQSYPWIDNPLGQN
ncbi:chitin deacetylase 8-like [Ostrinia nubilalis]|uniref:chitin deacetylase 8-like n=1 Tax=Ostrinia nubilalis TaxID=29057 RepID=UPI0030822766